jgi:penicillin-insensitive murein endopeptidase
MDLETFGTRVALSGVALVAMLVLAVPTVGARGDRELPEKFKKSPYHLMSLTVGHPNEGFQVRAKKLRNTRALEVRGRSRNKSYGHPALVLMLRRSARDVASVVPGSRMLVGDLSYKRGGPIPGHNSHESGRDADVAFYASNSKGKPVRLNEFVAFGADGKAKDGSYFRFDDARNWFLVQSWVKDDRAGLSHIFVSRPLKRRLLKFARSQKRFHKYIPKALTLLKQPERGEPHDDHFHVRISCPKRLREICRNESK